MRLQFVQYLERQFEKHKIFDITKSGYKILHFLRWNVWTVEQPSTNNLYIVYAIRSLYHDENIGIMAFSNGLISNSRENCCVQSLNERLLINMCDDILLRVPNVSKRDRERKERKRETDGMWRECLMPAATYKVLSFDAKYSKSMSIWSSIKYRVKNQYFPCYQHSKCVYVS